MMHFLVNKKNGCEAEGCYHHSTFVNNELTHTLILHEITQEYLNREV